MFKNKTERLSLMSIKIKSELKRGKTTKKLTKSSATTNVVCAAHCQIHWNKEKHKNISPGSNLPTLGLNDIKLKGLEIYL